MKQKLIIQKLLILNYSHPSRASFQHASTTSLTVCEVRQRYPSITAPNVWVPLSVAQSVTIERIPYRFDSWRPYFRCDCDRRIVKLYSAGHLFLCRHCCRLPYSSKNEGHWDRALRQRSKHRRRLGGNASLEAGKMPKPKGRSCGREPITASREAHRRRSGNLMIAFW